MLTEKNYGQQKVWKHKYLRKLLPFLLSSKMERNVTAETRESSKPPVIFKLAQNLWSED